MEIQNEEKFIKGVESLIDPMEVSNILFFQKLKRLLPSKIMKRFLYSASKKTPYIGFAIDPYSLFLFFRLSNIDYAKSLLPDRYELAKSRLFDDDEPDYYMGIGNLNTRASTFWGTRQEVYLIATDKKTGLLYHAWDESKQMYWANPKTGQSPNFWSRAIGWFGMGILDSLDFFPDNHPKINEILNIFISMLDSVIKYMDKKTGLWYQVTDQGGREGNYFEASASCMFLYSISKAINKGFINKSYKKYADKAFNGIINELIKIEDNGIITITNCCQVAGLGGNNRRDGSFEYYINEPVIDNDRKSTGSFISACLEYEKLI